MKLFNAVHTREPAPIAGLAPLEVLYQSSITSDRPDPDSPLDYDKLALALMQIPETIDVILDIEWDSRYPRFLRLETKNDLLRSRITIQDVTNTVATVRGNPVALYNYPLIPSGYAKWQPATLDVWKRRQDAMDKLGFGDDLSAVVIDGSPLHTDDIACYDSLVFDLDQIATRYPGRPVWVWLDMLATKPTLLGRLLDLCQRRQTDAVLWLPWHDDDNDGRWQPRDFNPAWPWVSVVQRHLGINP